MAVAAPTEAKRQIRGEMDQTTTIREARLADLPAASRLTITVFKQSVAPLFEPEGIQNFLAYAALDAWTGRHRDGQRTWLALKGERVVGVVQVRDGNHVSLFFVERRQQRQGLGRALIMTAINALGVGRLTVNSSPNSVDAYRRLGFAPVGPEDTKSGIRYTPMELIVAAPPTRGTRRKIERR